MNLFCRFIMAIVLFISMTAKASEDDPQEVLFRSSAQLKLVIPALAKLGNLADDFDLGEYLKGNNVLIKKPSRTSRISDPQAYLQKNLKRLKEGLIERAKELENDPTMYEHEIEGKDLISLYLTALPTLISFLPKDDNHMKELLSHERNYLLKTDRVLGRLFTYAYLDKIIKSEKFKHIKLPKKELMIRDVQTDQYLSRNNSLEFLYNNVALFAEIPSGLIYAGIRPEALANKHELVVFAQRIEKGDWRISKQAREELYKLLEFAPFDIGEDNIFADENGDAIIIDTEYKGENSERSIEKLKERY